MLRWYVHICVRIAAFVRVRMRQCTILVYTDMLVLRYVYTDMLVLRYVCTDMLVLRYVYADILVLRDVYTDMLVSSAQTRARIRTRICVCRGRWRRN